MITTMLQQTLIITTFVMGMMLIIEYINIQTRGMWSNSIQQSPFMQILLGTMMGIVPGCLGSYTMVSLYVHRVVMFPAIVATMIATSGDEAFLMFSMIPETAIKLHIVLFIIALVAGIIVHFTVKNKYIGLKKDVALPLHHRNEECNPYHPRQAIENFKHLSFTRALLIAGLLGLIFLFASGIIDGSHHLHTLMGNNVDLHHGHDHGPDDAGGHSEADWIRISLISIFVVILYIVSTVKEHFLQEHIWHHIIKKHLLKIFAWTFSVVFAIHLINQYVDLQTWITANLWIVLMLALLIGIIPESGPHYIFVLLFAQGSLPFSILLASSIAQDGHGTLPLLAETPKGFVAVKAVNLLVALLAGATGIFLGW